MLLRCTSEATYHYKKLIDGYLGQGLMDEISYMSGTFSDQSLKFSAKIQKEWNEEEKSWQNNTPDDIVPLHKAFL